MTPDNLATVLSPNLFRAPNNNFGLIMKNMGPITVLFKALITHVCLFSPFFTLWEYAILIISTLLCYDLDAFHL